MNDSVNESYLIFLDNKYFRKSFFGSVYKKIRKNLENKGIKVIPITEIMKKQSVQNNQNEITFDDKKYPDINTLYIHLFNGQYYNDSIYSKRKTEKEREMLLLIAGKLGVKESTYLTQITEIKIKKLSGGVNVKSLDASVSYEKTISKTQGQSGKEVYLNRGAPVYLNMKTTSEVSNNLKETIGEMKSKVFSYDYYCKNAKLESFVHKRFAFKMLKLEYTIEEDDLSDLSFSVKSSFFKYGINLEFNETIISREKITYTFEFYTDQDLMIKFNERDLEFSDDFVKIRLTYDKSNNKNIAIHHICDFVIEESKKCFYKYNNSNNKYSFFNRLNKWITSNPYEDFIEACKDLYSTTQIKNWIYRTLADEDMQIIHLDKSNNEIKSDIENNCIIKPSKIELNNKTSRSNSFCLNIKAPIYSNQDNDNDKINEPSDNEIKNIIRKIEEEEDADKMEKWGHTISARVQDDDKINQIEYLEKYISDLTKENENLKSQVENLEKYIRELSE